MIFEGWEWLVVVLAALLVGLAKTGIAGLGMVPVAVFANLMPAKEASGFLLPLLISADVIAVAVYRQHTQWKHLVRLFPWTGGGVLAGWAAMGRIDDRQASVLIGVIILVMVGLHVWWRRKPGREVGEELRWVAPMMGLLAGFTTLVANAAGPLMAIYLLAMRLPKLQFVGTAAVFFLLLNLFKVPFMVHLGLIDGRSLSGNLVLVPAVILGAAIGRRVLARIEQKRFERIALGLSAAAGVKLLF
jgi:uncharacterized protein